MFRLVLTSLLAVVLAACGHEAAQQDAAPVASQPRNTPVPAPLRVATFNVSLYRSEAGALISDLKKGQSAQLGALRAIIRDVDPDVLVLNEFDHDEGGEAIALFAASLGYPHALSLASNTGTPSGVDLDGDGVSDHPQGTREYGNDSFGYGVHPGQYAIALVSRHPIDEAGVRTFRQLLWRDMPGNLLPADYYSAEAQAILRLSSKTHADIPVQVGGKILHLLVAHPTPPGFDGVEDRNGRRNHDEIRLLTDYVSGGVAAWLVDDMGTAGGLSPEASFVIAGDLNADPADGDVVRQGERRAIRALLDHPRTTDPQPKSVGGSDAARRQGGVNAGHQGDPALDTADFSDSRAGNLRVDFVIPSSDLEIVGSGVYWPGEGEAGFEHVGAGFPPASSDHRLVWVDVLLGG